jgi:two-component system response regulator HydG
MSEVLVVEDDLLIADLLQCALKAGGYNISGVARTVAEAKESAERHPPDFAVIDIRLADGNLGTELGAYLRNTTPGPGIMYSTGNGADAGLSKLDGDAVMTKPYRLHDVARALDIIEQLRRSGQTHLRFPRNFRLLDPPTS